jgi:hypothetical protein
VQLNANASQYLHYKFFIRVQHGAQMEVFFHKILGTQKNYDLDPTLKGP